MIPLETIAEHLIDHAALKVTVPQLDARYVNVTGDAITGDLTVTGSLLTIAGTAATVPLIVKGAAAQAANLQQWKDSTDTKVALVDAAGHSAWGKNSLSTGYAFETYIATASGIGCASGMIADATAAAADNSHHAGFLGGVDVTGAGDQTKALDAEPGNAALYARVRVFSASTVTAAKGVVGALRFRTAAATGSVVDWACFYASNSSNAAGGAGAVTTQYGLYVENLNFAATNYAIYTQGGLHRFGDDLIIVDGKNIQLDTTTGTKIGTATTQKLGFFNAPPVTQRLKANYNNWAALGDVVNALVALGLFDQA